MIAPSSSDERGFIPFDRVGETRKAATSRTTKSTIQETGNAKDPWGR